MSVKKCRVCKAHFEPFNTLQRVCGPSCAAKHAENERGKADRREAAEYRARTKPKKSLLTEAQRAFNSYIRMRDSGAPCISCELFKNHSSLSGHAMDAGHWYGVGAHPELRFTLWNVRPQCVACNRDLSGHPHGYENGLLKRFGREWVEGRKQQARDKQPNHYSRDDLRRIKRIFTKRQRLYARLFRS
ncbi:recombination protein NinG [uncultured Paraglaciecola sp.]|uniref:recombination protein NinG n=1 Tax=uncultured Paraglaciecola sp. TaxID=1765024 RepID=UPI0026063E87|nr:recombination protein NinG [uncultured Paraglaciecola sp.]